MISLRLRSGIKRIFFAEPAFFAERNSVKSKPPDTPFDFAQGKKERLREKTFFG
jgi:hypothetical protein